MLRAVLAVVLATALLGASLPAVDRARQDHSGTTVRTELDRVERAANSLIDADDPTIVGTGARRVVTVRLPKESWTDAGTDAVSFASSHEGPGGRLAWTVRGGMRHVRHLPNVPLRTATGDPLTLRSAGNHRLVLSLDGTAVDPVVTIRRFTSDGGASTPHATVATDAKGRIGRQLPVSSGVRR